MRVFFDITHPAIVHFFKNLISDLISQGHSVLVTARDKDMTVPLLSSLGIPHTCISQRRASLIHALKELAARDMRLLRTARSFRPDLLVAAAAGVSIGPVGAALGIPRLVFDQVDIAPLQQFIGMPWATFICTSHSYLKDFGSRHVRFRGFLAQAYLDPSRFTPDPEPLRRAGLDPAQPYVLLRTVRWAANHDLGKAGLTHQQLALIVKRLSPYARVLLSSESPLPADLRKYGNPVPVEHLHDLLAFAALCIGEGGTVAPEAAILGTPAICYSPHSFRLGYLRSMEKDYELILRPPSFSETVATAERILQDPHAADRSLERRDRLFQQTENVADFMRQMIDRALQPSIRTKR